MLNVRYNRLRAMALAIAISSLGACTSVSYRCPLDPNDDSDSPTACAGMHDALAGAKKGAGSRTSVLMDAEGRLIPQEIAANKPRSPLTGAAAAEGAPEPYRNQSGDPVFQPPRVFQAWVPAFVDAEGQLHDGHHTWFSTPGRWSYGTTRAEGPASAADLMRPAMPNERPPGKVATPTVATQPATPPANAAGAAKPAPDKAALNNLSAAAKAMSKPADSAPAAQPGLTAPAVNLGE